jgi:hypothetical protein
MYICQTPILLLLFNRPDLTSRALDQLRLVRPKFLYVSCDGPRLDKPSDLEKISNIKNLVSTIDWDCKVYTNFFESNLGCGRAVSCGISWFFEYVEYGIILEDDISVNEYFFRYQEFYLEKLKDRTDIGSVCAYNILGDFARSNFLSNYPHIWGWGTWRRVWNKYKLDFDESSKDLELVFRRALNLNGSTIRRLSLYGIKVRDKVDNIDTWDFQFALLLCREGLKSVYPGLNLVVNLGFGIDSTHTLDFVKIKKYDFTLIHDRLELDLIYDKRRFSLEFPSIFKRIQNKLLTIKTNK